jgi:hypothetical protein
MFIESAHGDGTLQVTASLATTASIIYRGMRRVERAQASVHSTEKLTRFQHHCRACSCKIMPFVDGDRATRSRHVAWFRQGGIHHAVPALDIRRRWQLEPQLFPVGVQDDVNGFAAIGETDGECQAVRVVAPVGLKRPHAVPGDAGLSAVFRPVLRSFKDGVAVAKVNEAANKPVQVLFVALVSASNGDGPDEYSFKVDSNLRVAVAKVDISPPDGTPVTGHVRPTKGFRDRLQAVILLLEDGRTKAALVTHDLIASSPAVVEGFRDAVAKATGTPREQILVAASHNHSGPKWEAEPGWSQHVATKKIRKRSLLR